MALKKRFYSVGGRVLGERTPTGGRADYATDALGSVTAVVDTTGDTPVPVRYSPYGLQGGFGSSFQWVGSWGYRQTNRAFSSHYVRARHYASPLGQWTSVDPLWPSERAYGYVGCMPTSSVDPTGYQTQLPGQGSPLSPYIQYPERRSRPNSGPDIDCFDETAKAMVQRWCWKLRRTDIRAKWAAVNSCMDKTAAMFGRRCDPVDQASVVCMVRWCTTDGKVTCVPFRGGTAGETPCTADNTSTDPSDHIVLKVPSYGSSFVLEGGMGRRVRRFPSIDVVFLHELWHACHHGHEGRGNQPSRDDFTQCNDIFACCMFDVLHAGGNGSYCWKKAESYRKAKGWRLDQL
jgi:RHS repeat-associated protein